MAVKNVDGKASGAGCRRNDIGREELNSEDLDSLTEGLRQEYEIPGLAVCIGTSKGLMYERAFGYRNQLTGEELKEEHFFHMCSVTKLFTGTGVMKLAEEGRVDLDGLYVDQVPWFTMKSPRHRKMTVRQMLSHTSGMGDCDDYQWYQPRTDEEALKDYARSEEVTELPFIFKPGEGKFLYCNVAYELLGVLIEEVTGMTYDAYIQTAILEPLGMNSSTLLTFTRDMTQVCAPHGREGRGPLFVYEHFPYTRIHGPSSTLTTHLQDISKFAEAVLNRDSRIFKNEDAFRQVTEPVATVPDNGEFMGLSWFGREQCGFTLYGHEGTDDGFRTSFWLCPERDLYLVVLANRSKAPVKKINRILFERIV